MKDRKIFGSYNTAYTAMYQESLINEATTKIGHCSCSIHRAKETFILSYTVKKKMEVKIIRSGKRKRTVSTREIEGIPYGHRDGRLVGVGLPTLFL